MVTTIIIDITFNAVTDSMEFFSLDLSIGTSFVPHLDHSIGQSDDSLMDF